MDRGREGREEREGRGLDSQEVEGGTVGVKSVDAVLTQHLLHCEYLLQRLQASGPLTVRLSSGLARLQREADVVAQLLDMAAEPDTPPRIEQGELEGGYHWYRM